MSGRNHLTIQPTSVGEAVGEALEARPTVPEVVNVAITITAAAATTTAEATTTSAEAVGENPPTRRKTLPVRSQLPN